MIHNWLDCILWLGMLFIFLYAWIFNGKIRDGVADSTRINDTQDQANVFRRESFSDS
jgi:hypothetical protein